MDTPISRKKAATEEERIARRRAAVRRYELRVKATRDAEAHKEKTRAWDKARYERDKEKRLAASKAYKAQQAERIKVREQARYANNRAAHLEKCRKYYQENRAKVLHAVAQYRAKNPIAVANSKRKRKAAQKSAIASWYGELDALIMTEAAELCILRKQVTGIDWHIDHVVPLQSKLVCGLHIGNNIAVIPAKQNMSKKNRYWPDMP